MTADDDSGGPVTMQLPLAALLTLGVVTSAAAAAPGADRAWVTCFAMWPAVYTTQKYTPGGNTFRRCTAQFPFLANGMAIYGGERNAIEHCLLVDIATGAGILLSTTFNVADAAKNIDNHFSGLTSVQHCELVRCGGHDHDWKWRAAVQICADRGRRIADVDLGHLHITDSISDGFSVVAKGARYGEDLKGMLSGLVLHDTRISNFGLGAKDRHALWIGPGARGAMTISRSTIVETKNDSPDFSLHWK